MTMTHRNTNELSDTSYLIVHSMKPYTGGDLRAVRKYLGLTAQDMAGALGVSRATLCRLEKAADDLLSFPLACTVHHLKSCFSDLYVAA